MASKATAASLWADRGVVASRTRAGAVFAGTLIFTWIVATLLPIYRPLMTAHVHHGIQTFRSHLPAIQVDWYPNADPRLQFNSSKLALLIEARPLPHLVPQVLHMISVVPPDWRFLFVGTNKSVLAMDRSFATRYHQANGKLDMVVLPEPWTIDSKEDVYRLLTDVRFFDTYMPEVEWLLKFEADSMLCANSLDSLDDWLHFDWAGAPRHRDDRFAGNGGLTLRRLSVMRKILSFQNRVNDTLPEDEWYGRRLTNVPGVRIATGDMDSHLSVEEVYYPNPLGFHVLANLPDDIWKDHQRRKEIFDYCPELSMVMDMKLEVERCEGDNGQGTIVDPEKQA